MPVQPREEREANEVGDFPWPVWMTEPFRQTAHRPPMWTLATMIRALLLSSTPERSAVPRLAREYRIRWHYVMSLKPA
jgi:hypothetical protein